eukprot:XP_014018917.1 PREDICTED: F-BAR and double SH3 domains protein 2-like [Salmo salar]
MQPPPRKVKVTQELKNCHIEQMTRLHLKHQTECDLLEDMRAYSLKKGQLERDYVQVRACVVQPEYLSPLSEAREPCPWSRGF